MKSHKFRSLPSSFRPFLGLFLCLNFGATACSKSESTNESNTAPTAEKVANAVAETPPSFDIKPSTPPPIEPSAKPDKNLTARVETEIPWKTGLKFAPSAVSIDEVVHFFVPASALACKETDLLVSQLDDVLTLQVDPNQPLTRCAAPVLDRHIVVSNAVKTPKTIKLLDRSGKIVATAAVSMTLPVEVETFTKLEARDPKDDKEATVKLLGRDVVVEAGRDSATTAANSIAVTLGRYNGNCAQPSFRTWIEGDTLNIQESKADIGALCVAFHKIELQIKTSAPARKVVVRNTAGAVVEMRQKELWIR